jgi:polysaccharide biosynthesis transport protein
MTYETRGETEEPVSGHPAFSRLSILRTIWKRKRRIALVWALFTVCALALVRLLPTVYLSETLILIDSQKIPEKFVSATVASDLEDRIASIRQTLLSSGELKKIIEDFGLYREQRKNHFEEEILDMMRKDINITLESVGASGSSRDKRTAAFRIGYQGPDPQLVMRVANRLTDLYVEQNMKTRESQAAGTSDFLEKQLREAKKRLDELEGTISTFKLQHNGELPQQEQSLSSTLSRLQTELEANRDAINRAQQTRIILESNLMAMEANLSAQSRAWEQAQHAADQAASPLNADALSRTQPQKKVSEILQDQLEVLRRGYSERHPDVIRVKAEIDKVKRAEEHRGAADAAAQADTAKLAGSTAGARPAGLVREPAELARMREQIAGLRSQIRGSDKELEDRKAEQQRILRDLGTYQSRIERLPVREQEMAGITRDYEISKENYKSLLDKKTAAEMALDMERRQQSERFTVLDRARLPEKPVKPDRPLLYGLGTALALVLGLAVGFSAELRQNVVLGEWELPEGTPVLARLPNIEVALPDQTKPKAKKGWFSRKKPLADAPLSV